MKALRNGTFVAHPELTVAQGSKHRVCGDLSISGWNATQSIHEWLQLASPEDPLAYSTAVLEA